MTRSRHARPRRLPRSDTSVVYTNKSVREDRNQQEESVTNPNNLPGANATVVGNATGSVEVREFPSGGSQAQLGIAVNKGYKDRETGEWKDTGVDFYNLVAAPEYASENWPSVSKGDKVRVDDARLEARPYTSKDGEPRVDLQLRFGTLVVVEAKSDRVSSRATETVPF